MALLERLSPALEHVDSSSGAIGTAVDHAIAALVPVVVRAPADRETRPAWLDALRHARRDQIPYLERLADYWGELCGSPEVASASADRLIGSPVSHSTGQGRPRLLPRHTACLSALFTAARYEELTTLVKSDALWPYKQWAVKALAAMGTLDEAIAYAEGCRSPWVSNLHIDRLCEQILLSLGRTEEPPATVVDQSSGTYLAWFRAVQRLPARPPAAILATGRVTAAATRASGSRRRRARSCSTRRSRWQRRAMRSEDPDEGRQDFAQVNPAFATKPASRPCVGSRQGTVTRSRAWTSGPPTTRHCRRPRTPASARKPWVESARCFENPAARRGFAAGVLGPTLDLE